MHTLIALFNFEFFRNAFLAAFMASITCGIIGTYIVSRRIVFISGGITHASFGGIGMGYYFGIDPILGAIGFGASEKHPESKIPTNKYPKYLLIFSFFHVLTPSRRTALRLSIPSFLTLSNPPFFRRHRVISVRSPGMTFR